MSDNTSPTVAKLRQALTLLAKDKEAGLKLFSEVASEIEALEGRIEGLETSVIDPQEPPRFPDSRYVAFTSQHGSLTLPHDGAGVLWELTTRADSIEETLRQMIVLEKTAISLGFIPADKYIDQRRQERDTSVNNQAAVSFPHSAPPVVMSQPVQNGQQTMMTQLTKIAAGPLSDRDTTLVYKGMTGKSKHLVNIYLDSGNAALQKLTILGLDPNQPSSLFVKGVTEIPTPGWTCLVGLTDDGKWANKILDITPVK